MEPRRDTTNRLEARSIYCTNIVVLVSLQPRTTSSKLGSNAETRGSLLVDGPHADKFAARICGGLAARRCCVDALRYLCVPTRWTDPGMDREQAVSRSRCLQVRNMLATGGGVTGLVWQPIVLPHGPEVRSE